MSGQKDAIMGVLYELQEKLEALPEFNRNFTWSIVDDLKKSELLEARGNFANALKFLLDNTASVIAGIRQARQALESADRINQEAAKWRDENAKRFMGTLWLLMQRAADVLQHQKRERELLEANNRYQQEARDARAALNLAKLENLRAGPSVSYTPIGKISASVIEKLIAARENFKDRMEMLRPGSHDKGGYTLPDDIAAHVKDLFEKGQTIIFEPVTIRFRPAPTEITARDLRDILATLGSIDRHEILEAGYDMPDGSWDHFRSNPRERFLECNDECREAIVKVINNRRGAL
jgi:hypothetical protein